MPNADSKSYDMTIASGQLLGSYNERIQSTKSDKIYSDYYIQPIYIPKNDGTEGIIDTDTDGYITNVKKYDGFGGANGWKFVGSRALIQSYDYSFGYIYPTTGVAGLSTDVIGDGNGFFKSGSANAFCIYKFNNDPDIARTSRKCKFVAADFWEQTDYSFQETTGSTVGGRWVQ